MQLNPEEKAHKRIALSNLKATFASSVYFEASANMITSPSSSSRALHVGYGWKVVVASIFLLPVAWIYSNSTPKGPFKFIYSPLPTDSEEHRNEETLTLESLVREGLPRCDHPRLIRNAFSFPPEDEQRCKKNHCSDVVVDRLLSVVGENTVQAYPMEVLSKPLNKFTRHDSRFIEDVKVKNFLKDPKYERWVVHTQTQVGNWDEYRAILDMKGVNNLSRTEFDAITNVPNRDYVGSFVFFSRGSNTGSHMHYAVGSNIVFHMSGVKKWIIVSPEYWGANGANCTQTPHGGHGICFPNGYTAEDIPGKVSIDEYKEALLQAGVPSEAMLEFEIYPGDILINCDVWPHAVENLTPESTAWTLRFSPIPSNWDRFTFGVFRRGIFSALKTRFTMPNEATMLDAVYKGLVMRTPFLDSDPSVRTTKCLCK